MAGNRDARYLFAGGCDTGARQDRRGLQINRFIFALVFVLSLGLRAAWAEPHCAPLGFEGARYTVCRFDPSADQLRLFNLNQSGVPYGTLSALGAALQENGQTLVFAMNAGMYDVNLRPIGLYVENGKQAKKINRRSGSGNFHLKPNGVFYIDGGKAGVMETEAFVNAGLRPEFATQSGPMLVIDGEIHPKFSADGTSAKRRNGVGACGSEIVFAISEEGVNFYDFAKLFRDDLSCSNALFFDGTVSSLYSAELGRSDGFVPLGPMVGVVK